MNGTLFTFFGPMMHQTPTDMPLSYFDSLTPWTTTYKYGGPSCDGVHRMMSENS